MHSKSSTNLACNLLNKRQKKVVSLDWALTETTLSLGVMPQGIADVAGYKTWVAKPELGNNAIDVALAENPI